MFGWFEVKLGTETMLDIKLVTFVIKLGMLGGMESIEVTLNILGVIFVGKLVTFVDVLVMLVTSGEVLVTIVDAGVVVVTFVGLSVFSVESFVFEEVCGDLEVLGGDDEVLMGDLGDTDTELVIGVVIAIVSCV